MDQSGSAALNADQIAYWNGRGGEHWTRRLELNDAILNPIATAVLDRACVEPGERVADIGCGCGGSTLELAARAGSMGRVLGIDVSVPMLERARERANAMSGASQTRALAKMEFVCADATVQAFERGQTDLLFSRFGVMFFDDPVRAFTNMKTALRPGGRLVFVCWRAPALNSWLMMPFETVRGLVPPQPKTKPDDPGPFAFASQERVTRILSEAGFTQVALEPLDFTLDLATGRGLDAAVETAMEMGPTGRALADQPPEVLAAVAAKLRDTFAPLQTGPSVMLGAAVWIVVAQA